MRDETERKRERYGRLILSLSKLTILPSHSTISIMSSHLTIHHLKEELRPPKLIIVHQPSIMKNVKMDK